MECAGKAGFFSKIYGPTAPPRFLQPGTPDSGLPVDSLDLLKSADSRAAINPISLNPNAGFW